MFGLAKYRLIDLLRGTNVVSEFKKTIIEQKRNQKLLLDRQKQKLSNLLIFAKQNSYYQQYLNNFSNMQLVQVPVEVLKKIPISDKKTLTDNYSEIAKTKIESFEYAATGGSTGTPFKYLSSKHSISRVRAFNYFLWNKYVNFKFGDRILAVGGSSLGSNKGIKKRIYNFLQNKVFIPGDIINNQFVDKYVNKIIDGNFDIIYGYPSSIANIVRLLMNQGIVFEQKIKGVITTSEMLLINDKECIEEYFGCKILNIYGANDGGLISGSVHSDVFEYNGLDCFIEDVDFGLGLELVLTNLNSLVFPFIRYRVGDLGKLGSFKDNPFIIKSLQGRTRDFIINGNGVKFHGSLFNKIFLKNTSISRYQIIQAQDLSLTIVIETNDSQNLNDLEKIIKNKITTLLKDKLSISIHFNEKFEIQDNNKRKVIISYVD